MPGSPRVLPWLSRSRPVGGWALAKRVCYTWMGRKFKSARNLSHPTKTPLSAVVDTHTLGKPAGLLAQQARCGNVHRRGAKTGWKAEGC